MASSGCRVLLSTCHITADYHDLDLSSKKAITKLPAFRGFLTVMIGKRWLARVDGLG